MDSSSSRQEEEQRRQAEIRKQIALLQAQLVDTPGQASDASPPPSSPKRKQPEETCLAPATPSPKKRKLDHKPNAGQLNPKLTGRPLGSRGLQASFSRSESLKRPRQLKAPAALPLKPAPSNVLSKLAGLNNQSKDVSPMDNIIRSSAFAEKPVPQPKPDADVSMKSLDEAIDVPKRDDRLALIEDLEVGPTDHKPPFDDPHFRQLEPNSDIRLSSRTVPHDDVQEYLTGRFYLSPSRLYSAVRLLPNKQGYDVPVAGDWVTIAVVAERGQVKVSKAPVGIGREEEDNMDDEESNQLVGDGNGRLSFEDNKPVKPKRKDSAQRKPSGKKYVNMKLVDFGARSRSSATGGIATIRGDAFLSLLLFESDGYDKVTTDGGRVEKVYKGGSRGAFEAMSKLKEGDVVALLNPKVLKPFQRSTDTPHPTSNILAVTPESAASMVVLGRAKDLGMCQVIKRDGKVCGGWCDKRVSNVCEWHVQNAVQKRRAGRAEFSIGTSGMSTSSAPTRKPAYDPARKWGLKPEPSAVGGTGGSTTYVVSGHVVSGSAGDSRSAFVTETMGREGQAKAKRKFGRDADRELKVLLERDKEGMKAVVCAREVAKLMDEKNGKREKGKGKEVKTYGKGERKTKGKGKASVKARSEELSDSDSGSSLTIEDPKTENAQKNAYSAQIIKQLGFDPTMKPGQKRADDSTVNKKLEALTAVQSSRKEIELGPRPGQRIRSGVVVPPNLSGPKSVAASVPAEVIHDLDDSDSELERDLKEIGKPTLLNNMVDLDGSSDVEDRG